jgi:multiple sugar transport system substrate-binding protein
MKNKRLLIMMSALMILTLFLGACAPATQEAVETEEAVGEETEAVSEETEAVVEETEEAEVEQTTIRVMSFFAYDNPEVEAGVVEAFEAAYPNINVELEMVPFSDIFTKYKTLVAGGEAPDVISLNFDNTPQMAALGALEPLDDYIASDGYDMSVYYDNTVNMYKIDGVQWALPGTFSDVVLFYNKTLFDEAGLDYPAEDWGWDDLVSAGETLTQDTDGDGVTDIFGYALAWWPMYLFLNDANVLTEDGTACALNTPEAIEGLQKMIDLQSEGGIAPSRGDLAAQSDWDMFIAGRLAMFPVGPWAVQPFNDDIEGFEYDIAHHPAGEQKATFLFGNSYAMSASSENKDAAWEFLKFATGPEGSQIRQEGKYEISPVKKVAEGEFLNSLAGAPPENAIVFMEAVDYAMTTPKTPVWSEIHDAIWPELELALLGEVSVEEAMENACIAVNNVLE